MPPSLSLAVGFLDLQEHNYMGGATKVPNEATEDLLSYLSGSLIFGDSLV